MRRSGFRFRNPDPHAQGELQSRIDRGAKIDEWVFESGFGAPVIATELRSKRGWRNRQIGGYVADIRLAHESHDDPGMRFEASSNWFERPIVSKDINKLRRLVEDRFRAIDEGQRSVVWSEWVEVQIERRDLREKADAKDFDDKDDDAEKKDEKRGRRGEASLSMSWRVIKRGRTSAGEDITVTDHGRIGAFPQAKRAGDESDHRRVGKWGEGDYRDDESEYAYIEATPENLRALANLKLMIEAASARLSDLLGQGGIAKTLAQIGEGKLLLEARAS